MPVRRDKYAIRRDVFADHCVCSDAGMVSDIDWTDNLCPGTNVDMPADCRNSLGGGADRDLLVDQAPQLMRACGWIAMQLV